MTVMRMPGASLKLLRKRNPTSTLYQKRYGYNATAAERPKMDTPTDNAAADYRRTRHDHTFSDFISAQKFTLDQMSLRARHEPAAPTVSAEMVEGQPSAPIGRQPHWPACSLCG